MTSKYFKSRNDISYLRLVNRGKFQFKFQKELLSNKFVETYL